MVFKDNTFFSYVFLATTVILFAGHAHGANLCDNAPNKQVCNSIVGSRTNPRDAVIADLNKMVYENKAAKAEAKKQAASTEINICINIFESCIYYNKLALSYLNDGNRNVARDLIGGNIDSYQKCDDTFKNSGMNNPVAKSTKLLKDMASTGVYLSNLI